ncbi:DUF4810 domain-containing protein [Desulfobaculum sp.]
MKATTIAVFAAVLSILMLAGCQKTGIYYWGDYSETYYQYMQSPTEETLATHVQSIESVIEQSKRLNKAVPPGIYAEYGYYKLKAGQTDEAVKYFTLEKELYPESRIFMERLIAKTQTHEGDAEEQVAAPAGEEQSEAGTVAETTPAKTTAEAPASDK